MNRIIVLSATLIIICLNFSSVNCDKRIRINRIHLVRAKPGTAKKVKSPKVKVSKPKTMTTTTTMPTTTTTEAATTTTTTTEAATTESEETTETEEETTTENSYEENAEEA